MARVRAVGIFTFPALHEREVGKPCLVPVDDAMKRRFSVGTGPSRSTQRWRKIHPEAEGGDLRYILHAGFER